MLPQFTAGSPLRARVHGNFFVPDSVSDLLTGDEVTLMLVVEEISKQVLLFTADLGAGYDSEAGHFLDAEIYAAGFPSKVSATAVDGFMLDDEQDAWDLVHAEALEVDRPCQVDILLLDAEAIDFPETFADLMEGEGASRVPPMFNLTGQWALSEAYEFGTTTADLYLAQSGGNLSG